MPYVTEQTSKKWKGLQGLGCLASVTAMVIIGAVIASAEPGRHEPPTVAAYAMLGLFLGLSCYAIGRVGAWWFHG